MIHVIIILSIVYVIIKIRGLVIYLLRCVS